MIPRILFSPMKFILLCIVVACTVMAIGIVLGIFALNFLLITTTFLEQYTFWTSASKNIIFLPRVQARMQLQLATQEEKYTNRPPASKDKLFCTSNLVDKRLQNIMHILRGSHLPLGYPKYKSNCKTTLLLLDKLQSLIITMVNNKNNNNGHKSVTRKTIIKSPVIAASTSDGCREIYHGSSHGYPYFKTGFEIVNCPHIQNIADQITIVYLIDHVTNKTAKAQLRSMASQILYPGQRGTLNHVIYQVRKSQYNLHILSSTKHTKPLQFNASHDLWDKVLAQARTPYIIFALNEIQLKATPNITRLLFEANQLGFDSLGGAIKSPDHKWLLNCYQMRLRDYRLSLSSGYIRSSRECLSCDYFSGPVLIRTSTLKKMFGSGSLKMPTFGPSFFADLFIHMKIGRYKVGVCPDVLYSANQDTILTFKPQDTVFTSNKSIPWIQKFMLKWDLYQIITPSGAILTLPCQAEQGGELVNNLCFRQDADRIIHPCCRLKFHSMLKFVMDTCHMLEIPCEIQEGTLLGAVKLGVTLPWDRDGDVSFLSSSFTRLVKAQSIFDAAGYQLLQASNPTCCVDDIIAGGKFIVQSAGMHIEMFGQHIMRSRTINAPTLSDINNSTETKEVYSEPTKVLVAGHWISGPENPGLHVRNRYGRNLYKHSPHWMSDEMADGWQTYKTFKFASCSSQWYHSCLDQIKTDGNIDILR